MRACLVLALATGCATGSSVRPPPSDPDDHPRSTLADEDAYRPTYGKPELQRALIAERGAEATAERRVTDLEARPDDSLVTDQLRVAAADLAVRRRFIQTLEACDAAGRWCPPRLDDPPWAFDPDPDGPPDPPMTAALRFDVEGWRALAAELHGRACACRTISCVDSVGVAVDQLELRTAVAIQGDETATLSVTRARECLFRLRGKSAIRALPAAAEE
ncbi:MAG TPA: hypothetical protein VLM79_28940 [Kofleriaceae bacterium]|nr:hypothetical protein [Kofleriaceae bacterium]